MHTKAVKVSAFNESVMRHTCSEAATASGSDAVLISECLRFTYEKQKLGEIVINLQRILRIV